MKTRLTSILLSGALLVTAAGCSKSEDASGDADINYTNVTAAEAKTQRITATITNTGEVKPSAEVIVTPKVSGKVNEVYVDIGQYVNAGDVLFTIDDTDYRLQYNQAQASYNSAQANYNSTVGGTQKQSVSQAEQSLTAAQSEYDSALQNYDREKALYENNSNVVLAQSAVNDAKSARDRAYALYDTDVALMSARNALENAKTAYEQTQRLFEMGAVSQTDLDNARMAFENADANFKAQESNAKTNLESADSAVLKAEENLRTASVNAAAAFDAAKTRLKNAEAGLQTAKENYTLTVNVLNPERKATAQASVKSAKAALDIAKNTLDNASVKAPISGYVTLCNAVVGQNVAAGSSAVTLINADSMDIQLNLTEAVVTRVQPGDTVIIHVPAADIRGLGGTVAAVSPAKDAASGLFAVKINVPNSDGTLKGGMFADVEIITEEADDVLAVPTDTLIEEDDKTFVYRLEGETAVKTHVVTGIENEEYTEILSGLEEGEMVVKTGKEFLKQDQCPVKVITE